MLFPLEKKNIFFTLIKVNFGTCVKPRVSGCVHPLVGRHGEEANLRMMHFLFEIALENLSKKSHLSQIWTTFHLVELAACEQGDPRYL